MPLEQELKFFESKKAELLAHYKGKYALIKGEQFIGAYDTTQAAFDAGVDRFGTSAFLIKPIIEKERVEHVPALTHHLLNAHL